MVEDNLRIRAMDFAIAARTSPGEDIVELAKRIYAFLDPFHDVMPVKDALAYAGDIVSNMPPPIPQQDLGKADQSPSWNASVFMSHDAIHVFDENDTPTRIVRTQAEVE